MDYALLPPASALGMSRVKTQPEEFFSINIKIFFAKYCQKKAKLTEKGE